MVECKYLQFYGVLIAMVMGWVMVMVDGGDVDVM